MLEDDFNDCLKKAIQGHGCSVANLSQLSGIAEKRIIDCLNGREDTAVMHSLAPHLQLDSEKLISLKNFNPDTHPIPGLTRCVSPFGHLGVNAYIVNFGDTFLVFDTGTDSRELHDLAPKPQKLFITHGHYDHTDGVDTFHCPVLPPEDIHHGDTLHFEGLCIKALDVSGHYTPARAYFIEGLIKPVCIVGDCIFAGSIGKCSTPSSYSTALANIRDHILTLPDETILCPGHGPLTSVYHEKQSNPFF